MDEMKHTAGPWTFEDGLIIANGERLKLIGVETPMTAGPSRLEAIANARLIAATPEMLEALERIAAMSAGGPHTSAKDGMSAALAALDRARDIACAAISKATES